MIVIKRGIDAYASWVWEIQQHVLIFTLLIFSSLVEIEH